MKYSEMALLVEELVVKEYDNNYYPHTSYIKAYEKGIEDIIRVLCDKGVIDNSDELEREREGGY